MVPIRRKVFGVAVTRFVHILFPAPTTFIPVVDIADIFSSLLDVAELGKANQTSS
jgi:hypothetical protein